MLACVLQCAFGPFVLNVIVSVGLDMYAQAHAHDEEDIPCIPDTALQHQPDPGKIEDRYQVPTYALQLVYIRLGRLLGDMNLQ